MFEVFPLFPNIVSANVLDTNLSDLANSLENIEYNTVGKYDCNLSYASTDMCLLDKHHIIKELILENFNQFKNDILRLTNTEFKITTSWATKTLPNGYSHAHTHKNSCYSAVMYFDCCESGGNLLFENYGIKPDSFMLNDPSEWNFYNIENFEIAPEKNLIVYFPSYLRHRITQYTGNKPRYSVAVNFYPTGTFGYGDSMVSVY
jgi:uncharacterized protein (TIGR02466 family)